MKNLKRREHLKNTDGFTIVEMMIACVICLVITVAASTHFITVAKSLENADRYASQAIQQQNGSYFKEYFVKASPTYHFLKLPIAVACANSSSPCLRRYDSDSRRFVPNEVVPADSELSAYIGSRLDPSKGLQFYRDGTGSLSTKKSSNIALPPVVPGVPLLNAPIVQYPLPVNTAAAVGDTHTNAIYATWPLRDVSSPPFPVMIQKDNYVLFSHVTTLATSSTLAHHMAFFTSKAPTTLFPALENSLAAIYTLNDPSEYSIQFIKRIVDCSDAANTGQCLAWAMSINPGIGSISKAGTSSTAFSDLVNKGLVAIEIYDPFQAPGTTIATDLAKALPQLSIFNPSVGSVRWQNAIAPDFYAFPGDLWSMYDGASVTANTDLAPPFDVRRVQHYYTNLQSQIQIVLLPVDLATFWLEQSPSDPKQLNLVSQYVRDSSNTAGKQKHTMIDDVIPNPQNLPPGALPQILYFSRKLGTPTVDVVIEQTGATK